MCKETRVKANTVTSLVNIITIIGTIFLLEYIDGYGVSWSLILSPSSGNGKKALASVYFKYSNSNVIRRNNVNITLIYMVNSVNITLIYMVNSVNITLIYMVNSVNITLIYMVNSVNITLIYMVNSVDITLIYMVNSVNIILILHICKVNSVHMCK